jgi:3-hydroxyacyl-[acyl-carrier-protein] dehydratase/UDP-3-O-[3-hydroxymyristoyl] N-acetylglucosamine deacetylase/3-hydroxyacyl-[acyl-carrier-protein] dehydratase
MDLNSKANNIATGSVPITATYPFLFFDRVLEQTSNSMELLKNTSADEWCACSPGMIFPGWAVLEVMAQAAGRLGQALEPGTAYRNRLLARIKHARFRRAVHSGEQLRIRVNLIKVFSNSMAMHVAVRTETGRIADADLYFFRF